jgi:hypothetical protein
VYLNSTSTSPAVVLDYYTMTDYGVTRKHLETVINEYIGLIDNFKTLWQETQ